jgi:hypothetical protein
MPGVKQAWPMVAACWSPAMPEIAIGPPKESRVAVAEFGGGVFYFRQHRTRHAQQFQEFVVPFAGVDVEQQRARGVGGVGRVHTASGQPPQQIAIDGAEQQFAAARRVRARPAHGRGSRRLWCPRNRVDDQAGPGRDVRLVAFALQLGADV